MNLSRTSGLPFESLDEVISLLEKARGWVKPLAAGLRPAFSIKMTFSNCPRNRSRLATLENPYAEVYGLTGIIGSGKSTAAKFLSELGAHVIDADEIAKSIYDPGYENFAETKRQIILQFGPNAFSGDLLNKQVLAEAAFKDHEYLEKLNAIIHPQVKQIFKSRLRQVPKGVLIVYDVPLLFEAELNDLVKAVILVYVPEELAVKRALSRNNQAEADIRARLKKQISIEKKRKMADYVIDNSGDLKSLYEKLNALYRNLTNGRK